MNSTNSEQRVQDGSAYTKEPNGFVVSMTAMLQRGPTLCFPEAEGQSAIYLASFGYEVLVFDAPDSSLAHVSHLASEQGVSIETQPMDLRELELGEERFENIVSVFYHVPSRLRRRLHAGVVRALRPGGMFLLEGFRPEQLGFASGGPTELDLLMERSQIERELTGLEMIRVGEVVRRFSEGSWFESCGAVLEILARKPLVHRPRGAVH